MINFIIGAILSATAGYVGMEVATSTNVKTMEAAKEGLNRALKVAYAGGAVMGFTVVALALLGISMMFFIFAISRDPNSNTQAYFQLYMQDSIRWLSGLAFGASSIALFARVAGGIYTKAADVGADLVGKVESDIPEDDPRNPATIADNVGDNVGDVAGMGADLFESLIGSIVAATTLSNNNRELAYPFWIVGFGVVACVIGYFVVRTKDNATQKQLLKALHGSVYLTAFLVLGISALVTWLLFSDDYGSRFSNNTACYEQYNKCIVDESRGPNIADRFESCLADGSMECGNNAWSYYGCVVIGLIAGIVIGESTEYATSYAFKPTISITNAGSMGGASTVVIQGLGIGMLSTFPPTLVIVAVIFACNALGGIYGVGIAACGMLSTLGVTLATDAYGPIADNAGGIAEMCPDCPDEVRERTDLLDALGNTTAATGKGFAIGSAVLASVVLMSAYVRDVPVPNESFVLDAVDPMVIAGFIFGAMLPFLFAALTMLSVRKAAAAIIVEVQRQFKEIPGLLEGKPGVVCDSTTCVKQCTRSSLVEMILPGVIAVFTPIGFGLLVGARALAGFLIGSIAAGFLLALMMANAGGAWDNAKKYVENEGVHGGKGSDTHKAVVVGDTVGDPFKDTSGPALNILIKLMSIFALLSSPIFRNDWQVWYQGLPVLGGEVIIIIIVWYFVWHRNPPAEPDTIVSGKDEEVGEGSTEPDAETAEVELASGRSP